MSIKAEAAEGGSAADMVGVPKSTLFSWGKLRRENRLEPRFRRPRRVRRVNWPKSLVRKVKEVRRDQPM